MYKFNFIINNEHKTTQFELHTGYCIGRLK